MAKRNMHPNSLENLKKGKDTEFKSGEEAAMKGSKGGIKSGEAKREKKAFMEVCKVVLEKNQEVALVDLAADLANASADMKIKILQFLADYSGQKPKENLSVENSSTLIIQPVKGK